MPTSEPVPLRSAATVVVLRPGIGSGPAEILDQIATFTFTSAVPSLLLCYKFGSEEYQPYPYVCCVHMCE